MPRLMPNARAAIFLSLWLIAGAAAQPVVDQTEGAAADTVESAEPLWEAGVVAGAISQAAYPGSEERVSRLLGLPFIIYRGKYLRIDRGTVGVRAIKTPRYEMDVGFSGSLGARSSDIEIRRGMDDLGLLLEFGPRLKINLGDGHDAGRNSRIQLAARGVFDVNEQMRYRGIAFEPQWVHEFRLADAWQSAASLGAVLGNQQLADTFYRVTDAEASAARPAYQAQNGLISWRASLFVSRMVGHDMRIFSYMRYDALQGAANYNSPLVRRDGGWYAAVGLAWTLLHAERRESD